jgi:hypothetical protein
MQHHEQSVGGFLGAEGVRLTVYRQNCRTPGCDPVLDTPANIKYNRNNKKLHKIHPSKSEIPYFRFD